MKMMIDHIALHFPDKSMSEEEFFSFCAANPDQPTERDQKGNILIMAPTNFESGHYGSAAIIALGNWNNQNGTGYVLSSSTGFTLPNGAVRSPDAAWVRKSRMDRLPISERQTFAHICPDFVIEIRSKTDQIRVLQLKMMEYLDNGAMLGFPIDPYDRKAYVYKRDAAVMITDDFNAVLNGVDILNGFELPLSLFAA